MAQRHRVDFGDRQSTLIISERIVQEAVDRKLEQMNRDRILNSSELDATGWQVVFNITAATILALISSAAIWSALWLWTHLPIS